MIEIPVINRTKKTPKPRYHKPDSVKQLEQDMRLFIALMISYSK